MKFGLPSVVILCSAISAVVVTTIAVEQRYENSTDAERTHGALAGEQELGKLDTELKLLDLEIKQFRTIREARPLTQEEVDRLDYLRQRRTLIEARLLEAIKTA